MTPSMTLFGILTTVVLTGLVVGFLAGCLFTAGRRAEQVADLERQVQALGNERALRFGQPPVALAPSGAHARTRVNGSVWGGGR